MISYSNDFCKVELGSQKKKKTTGAGISTRFPSLLIQPEFWRCEVGNLGCSYVCFNSHLKMSFVLLNGNIPMVDVVS